jgi:outer membrane protein assembly factor BamB/orotate phosphoribosyltransferase
MSTYTQKPSDIVGQPRSWLLQKVSSCIVRPENPLLVSGGPTWIFDIKSICLDPEILSVAAKLFWQTFAHIRECQVGGLETASVPFVAAVVLEGAAQGRKVSGFYVRKGRKKQDLTKHVEGVKTPAPIILVDDVMNRGRGFERQCVVLEEEQWPAVMAVFALVRFRDHTAYPFLIDRSIQIYSVFTLSDFNLSLPSPDQYRKLDIAVSSYVKSKYADTLLTGPRACPTRLDSVFWWGADHGHIWEINANNFSVASHTKVGFWSKQHFFLSPVCSGSCVYFFSHRGVLYVFSAATKKLIRHIAVFDDASDCVLLMGNTQVVCVGNDAGRGCITVLDSVTLAELWRYEASGAIRSSVVKIGDEGFLCTDTRGHLYSVIGRKVKKRKAFPDGRVSLTYDRVGEKLYAVHESGILYRASLAHLHFEKYADFSVPLFATPCIADGVVYLSTLSGDLLALDESTGDVRWTINLGARCVNTPTVAGGRLYIGTNAGRLHIFDTASGKEHGTFLVSERIVSTVTVESENTIMFVTALNQVYRLRIDPAVLPSDRD